MNEGQAQRLLERVMVLAGNTKGSEAIASLFHSRGGNSRFAVNEITSSSEVEALSLSVTYKIGEREATATTNQLDDRSIDDVVGRAQRMAKIAPKNPEAMPVLGKQKYQAVPKASDPATVSFTPAARAKAVDTMLSAATSAKVTIAGFYEHSLYLRAIATSAGLSAAHAWTQASLSCTARTPDGTGSGWAGAQSNKVGDLDVPLLAQTAVTKASTSAKSRRLEPGKYTVVLEPAAVASMLDSLTGAFGARRADEGRSFFTKPGGGTKVGEKLFPEHVTLRSDPFDAALAGNPFDGDGLPLAATTWIDRGTVKGLRYDRYWAKKQGATPSGYPNGWILEGGKATRDELIKGVKRGVLITRFWYIRELDPQTLLLTGLTRDGTFLIENGAIAGPVNNFRFNESPVQMLARCDALTAGVLTEGMRVPALRTHEFNLASISEAV
jgi:predicted Zn-dependent protease